MNCQTIEQVAKKYGIGRNKLFKFLRDSKVLQRAVGNPPYQQYIDSGDFEVEGKVRKLDDKSYLYSQTMVTGKGEKSTSASCSVRPVCCQRKKPRNRRRPLATYSKWSTKG